MASVLESAADPFRELHPERRCFRFRFETRLPSFAFRFSCFVSFFPRRSLRGTDACVHVLRDPSTPYATTGPEPRRTIARETSGLFQRRATFQEPSMTRSSSSLSLVEVLPRSVRSIVAVGLVLSSAVNPSIRCLLTRSPNPPGSIDPVP